jgi:DNA-binding winged helix-turn-helix (wHTH) protein
MNGEILEFGPFRLLLDRRELLLRGRLVQLGPRALDLLIALTRRQGGLATKDELMSEIWPGRLVEENNLHVQASALRRAPAEGGGATRYLMTVPGRGYRFVAPVERVVASARPDLAGAGPGLFSRLDYRPTGLQRQGLQRQPV